MKLADMTVQEQADKLNLFIANRDGYLVEYDGNRLTTSIITYASDKSKWWSFYDEGWNRQWHKEAEMRAELTKVLVMPLDEPFPWWEAEA